MRHGVNKYSSTKKFNRSAGKTRRENLAVARGGFRL